MCLSYFITDCSLKIIHEQSCTVCTQLFRAAWQYQFFLQTIYFWKTQENTWLLLVFDVAKYCVYQSLKIVLCQKNWSVSDSLTYHLFVLSLDNMMQPATGKPMVNHQPCQTSKAFELFKFVLVMFKCPKDITHSVINWDKTLCSM